MEQTQPTILIVDDTPENITFVKGIFADTCKVKMALSGEDALTIARSSYLDLILLDIRMPDMDGYEVCTRLKQHEATRDIPVIFVTALNEISDEAKGFEAGCVDYLTKPINPIIALARVKTHVELRRARLELQNWNQNLKRKVIDNAGIIRKQVEKINSLKE